MYRHKMQLEAGYIDPTKQHMPPTTQILASNLKVLHALDTTAAAAECIEEEENGLGRMGEEGEE